MMKDFQIRLFQGLLVVLLAGFAFGYGIQERSLRRASEGRVARVAQEMLDSGDWIVPHLNGEVRVKKPPGSSWLAACAAKVFPADDLPIVRPWHALLPQALAGVILALLLYLWLSIPREGEMETPGQARTRGLYGALCLMMMPAMLGQGRSAEMDMSIALICATAFFCWERWAMARSKAGLLGFYGVLGLGFLFKGHVPLLICVLPVGVWGLWEARRRRAGQRRQGNIEASARPQEQVAWAWHLAGLGLLLAPILAWGIPFLSRSGIQWEDVYREGVDRFGGRTGHQEPPYFYVVNFVPWMGGWAISLFCVMVYDLKRGADKESQEGPYRRRCLWWCWFLVNLLFWSLLSAKQRHYMIPWLTPMALIVGDGLMGLAFERREELKRRATVCLMITAAGVGIGLVAQLFQAADKEVLRSAIWLPIGVLVSCVVAGWCFVNRKLGPAVGLWALAGLVAVAVYVGGHERQEDLASSPQKYCDKVRVKVPASATLYDTGVAWRDAVVLYYLRRNVEPIKAKLSKQENSLEKKKRQELLLERQLEKVRAVLEAGDSDHYILMYRHVKEKLPPSLYQDVLPEEPRFTGHARTVCLIRARSLRR